MYFRGPWFRGMGRRWWPRGWCWWWYYYTGQAQQFPMQNWYPGQFSQQQIQAQSSQNAWQQPYSISDEDVKRRAQEILNSAIVGDQFPGAPYTSIIYNGMVVGYMWERVPLNKVKVGGVASFGARKQVALIYNNRIIGYIWVW